MSRFFPLLYCALALLTLSCSSTTSTMMTTSERFPGVPLEKKGVVLPVGAGSAWDAGMVESPVVWYDSSRAMYGMVYTGYGRTDTTHRGYKYVTGPRIGLAWSRDLLHWEKDGRSPIFAGSGTEGAPDSHGASGPFLYAEGGTYYLFYFGVTGKGYEKGTKSLNLATSKDLHTWTRFAGNPVIAPAGSGWRRDAIWHPNIVKRGATYYLFFNASGIVNGKEEEYIGYAASDDLMHWRVDDEHSPILVGSGIAGRWDASGRAGDPSVFPIGDRWYMAWYSWDRKHTSDGLAWTTDAEFPLGWSVYEHNPVLTIGAPGSFDDEHAGKPFIIRAEGMHYHFYTAVAVDQTRQIAVACAPL